MIKKKVLVQGSLQSLQEFFSSKFNVEFEPLAILTDATSKLMLSMSSTSGTLPEIFTIDTLPRFSFRFIDGIVLTDNKSRTENINRLLKLGLEPRKIILWNNRGELEFFDIKGKDGSPIVFMEGLQFHIRNQNDLNFFHEMHFVLQHQRQFYTIDPKFYPTIVEQQYQQFMRKPLDWNNLQTWTEKMQWIKLYDSTPIKTRLADKYLVRQWVAEKIGQEYLIPLLGVWDNFDEIDFDILPNQFVLKCNHGSGMNIICRDKNNFDFEDARQKLTGWLAVDFGMRFFEPHYCNIKRKIIAEKFMTDKDNPGLKDYKFWGFGGKVFYCAYETRDPADWFAPDYLMDFFDMNWNHTEIERYDHPRNEKISHFPKPKNFELMKKLASKLVEDFPHVCADLYEIEDKVYFGEMTFTRSCGNIKFKSKGTDEHFGSLMTLPKEKYLFWEKKFIGVD
ncbi:MAG: hypothetical protein IKZ58_01945 [Selenomonadaceae bacterium]|nr:hypothetical protein [Selenomonadaceae bacterium]